MTFIAPAAPTVISTSAPVNGRPVSSASCAATAARVSGNPPFGM